MIEPYIRPFFQTILGDPLAKFLGKTLSPNSITYLSILAGLCIVPALHFHCSYLALTLLLLSGLFDTLDGTVARLFGKSSPFGTALDIIGDRMVEFAILLGLFLVSPETRALSVLLMLGSILICVTSFLVIGIFTENTSHKGFHYSPGLMERPEAFMFFGAMILLPELFTLLSISFSVLVFLTAFIRIIEFKRANNT